MDDNPSRFYPEKFEVHIVLNPGLSCVFGYIYSNILLIQNSNSGHATFMKHNWELKESTQKSFEESKGRSPMCSLKAHVVPSLLGNALFFFLRLFPHALHIATVYVIIQTRGRWGASDWKATVYQFMVTHW